MRHRCARAIFIINCNGKRSFKLQYPHTRSQTFSFTKVQLYFSKHRFSSWDEKSTSKKNICYLVSCSFVFFHLFYHCVLLFSSYRFCFSFCFSISHSLLHSLIKWWNATINESVELHTVCVCVCALAFATRVASSTGSHLQQSLMTLIMNQLLRIDSMCCYFSISAARYCRHYLTRVGMLMLCLLDFATTLCLTSQFSDFVPWTWLIVTRLWCIYGKKKLRSNEAIVRNYHHQSTSTATLPVKWLTKTSFSHTKHQNGLCKHFSPFHQPKILSSRESASKMQRVEIFPRNLWPSHLATPTLHIWQ